LRELERLFEVSWIMPSPRTGTLPAAAPARIPSRSRSTDRRPASSDAVGRSWGGLVQHHLQHAMRWPASASDRAAYFIRTALRGTLKARGAARSGRAGDRPASQRHPRLRPRFRATWTSLLKAVCASSSGLPGCCTQDADHRRGLVHRWLVQPRLSQPPIQLGSDAGCSTSGLPAAGGEVPRRPGVVRADRAGRVPQAWRLEQASGALLSTSSASGFERWLSMRPRA